MQVAKETPSVPNFPFLDLKQCHIGQKLLLSRLDITIHSLYPSEAIHGCTANKPKFPEATGVELVVH